MPRKIIRLEQEIFELNEICLHKEGTKDCLRNYITIGNGNTEDNKIREKRGLKPITDASNLLDSTKNGRVTAKDIHGISVSGAYRIREIYYGDMSGDSNLSSCISFREYVFLGRPKSVKLKTTREIIPFKAN